MGSKWTRVKELTIRAAEHRREREAAQDNGVIRGGGSTTWDGRVLRIGGGGHGVKRPMDKHWKTHAAPAAIPLQAITSAWSFGPFVHVTTTDGREIRFSGPKRMAEAIIDAMGR
jgi:hypothetical protein